MAEITPLAATVVTVGKDEPYPTGTPTDVSLPAVKRAQELTTAAKWESQRVANLLAGGMISGGGGGAVTVYVFRDGAVVPKRTVEPPKFAKNVNLSAPNVSRFESYQSPIDDRTISSDRQREMDLFNSGSYDERDVGPTHPIAKAKKARKEANASRSAGPEQSDFWR